MAKPREKAQEKNGQSDTDIGADDQPQPVHQRPRTIDEAKAQHGMLGAKSQQKGGANRLRMDSTVDAVKTSYGDYDQQFVDAVSTRWHQLLEDRSGEGTVVVEFKLYPDGRVTDLQTAHNEVSDMLALLCMQAISDPAPYRPWPMDMRRDFPEGFRLLRFTFYYGLD
jgi:outer membrane biosynthesis protein TonB